MVLLGGGDPSWWLSAPGQSDSDREGTEPRCARAVSSQWRLAR
jgi:hypothetical protein